MPKKVFSESFTKFECVFVALLEFKTRPKFDEGIFESYVHLNIVVPALFQEPNVRRWPHCYQNNLGLSNLRLHF